MQQAPLFRSSSARFALCLSAALALASCAEDVTPDLPGPTFGDSGNTSVIGDATTSTGGGADTGTVVATPNDAGVTPPAADTGTTPPKDGGGTTPPVANSQWCKVQAVLKTRCGACHDGTGTGPMPLNTYADLQATSATVAGAKIYTRVGVRMTATTKPMPPQGEVPADEKKLVTDWIAAGAPGSATDTCTAAPTPDGGVVVPSDEWPSNCDETHKFIANSGGSGKYTVRAGAEYYQDFNFTAPWKEAVHAVAFRSITDNKKVLHHWILYSGASSFLVGWSPGKNEKALPPDVGVYMPGAGASLRLTAHYYNSGAGAKAEQDGSGVEICVMKTKRPKTAFTMPFAASPSVPAGQMVENSSTCTVTGATEPVHLITSSPHMHKLGVGAKLVITHADGTKDIVHDKPFDFEEQTTWPVDYVLKNGDKVTTTCVFKNTTTRAVGFGTNTDQEMCFNFALYYPMCGMTCNQSGLAQVYQSANGNGCPTGGGLGF